MGYGINIYKYKQLYGYEVKLNTYHINIYEYLYYISYSIYNALNWQLSPGRAMRVLACFGSWLLTPIYMCVYSMRDKWIEKRRKKKIPETQNGIVQCMFSMTQMKNASGGTGQITIEEWRQRYTRHRTHLIIIYDDIIIYISFQPEIAIGAHIFCGQCHRRSSTHTPLRVYSSFAVAALTVHALALSLSLYPHLSI